MKKMTKKLLCALLALVMVLGLAACGSGVKVPDEYKEHVSPWELNVAEAAKADGKMHYYFMSAEEAKEYGLVDEIMVKR